MANESKLVVDSDSTGYYITVVSGNTLYSIASHFKGKKVGRMLRIVKNIRRGLVKRNSS